MFLRCINEIWLLDYNMFTTPMFKCDWVDSSHGVKFDELGLTLVELGRVDRKTDSFILASQVKQVFYIQDQLDPKLSIVLSTPSKECVTNDDEDDLMDPCNEHQPFIHGLPGVESFDLEEEGTSSYIREDVEGIWL